MTISWSLIFSLIIGFLGIDILIILHETGHFVFAKIFHVYVEKVQIGLGPSFVKKMGKNGTEYSLGIIPYGAFCRMDTTSLEVINPIKKIAIYLAGPLFNILFAVICYSIYLGFMQTAFLQSLKMSVLQCLYEMRMFAGALGKMITGQQRISETFSGLFNTSITIGNLTKDGFSSGFATGLANASWIVASVSISLAFANLIPIPALDGGFIFITVIEIIIGRKIKEKAQVMLQIIGLVTLLVLLPVARFFF